jgi:hypothetical protein
MTGEEDGQVVLREAKQRFRKVLALENDMEHSMEL